MSSNKKWLHRYFATKADTMKAILCEIDLNKKVLNFYIELEHLIHCLVWLWNYYFLFVTLYILVLYKLGKC